METCDPSNFLVKVVAYDVSKACLVNRCQLEQIDWGPWCDRIVGVRTSGLSQSMILLKLDHEILGSKWGTLLPLVPESSGTRKASKWVSSKKQVNLIREKGWSVFEEPVSRLTNLLEVSNQSQNRYSGWC